MIRSIHLINFYMAIKSYFKDHWITWGIFLIRYTKEQATICIKRRYDFLIWLSRAEKKRLKIYALKCYWQIFLIGVITIYPLPYIFLIFYNVSIDYLYNQIFTSTKLHTGIGRGFFFLNFKPVYQRGVFVSNPNSVIVAKWSTVGDKLIRRKRYTRYLKTGMSGATCQQAVIESIDKKETGISTQTTTGMLLYNL